MCSLNNSEDSDDDETSFSEDRKKKDVTLVRLYILFAVKNCGTSVVYFYDLIFQFYGPSLFGLPDSKFEPFFLYRLIKQYFSNPF